MASVLENVWPKSRESSADSDRNFEMCASETELCDTLLALLDNGRTKAVRYCFFIDALGECDGDRAVLLSLLDKLVARPHVKVCASSCPWPSLEQYFRFSKRLTLQSLTSEDISLYVRERLRQYAARVHNSIADTSMEKLALEIISRSNGIFLWAVLVTREVCEGLEKGDSCDILSQRLQSTPSGIRDLTAVILGRHIDAVYRDRATDYLSLRSASNQPVNLLTFSVACLKEISVADQDNLTSIPMYDVQPAIEEITKTLSARTAGLLEVSYDANKVGHGREHPIFSLTWHDVGFLHDSIASIVQNSLSRSVVSLMRLLKASVLIGIWLRNDKQAWTLSALVYKQAHQFAKSISVLDPTERGHEVFLDLLETHEAHGHLTEISGRLLE